MKWVDSNLENVLALMNKLEKTTKPLWGTMTAQQMVEHLSHTLQIAIGKVSYELQVTPEKHEGMKQFILSEKPLPKNFQAVFAPVHPSTAFDELELAVDDYCEKWFDFESFFAENPDRETNHPHFGPLNYELWKRLHEKHLTHHFIQFGLIEE